MLVLEVEFLGSFRATRFNDRRRAEWPPHPVRLYSALVAVHHSAPRAEPDERDQRRRERAALEWLAAAPPPAFYAGAADLRAVRTHYVPVNDVSALVHGRIDKALLELRRCEAALVEAIEEATDEERKALDKALDKARAKLIETARGAANQPLDLKRKAGSTPPPVLPAHRTKQPRTFPVATPRDPRVLWFWDADPPVPVREALARLARRLARLGHSSSLVRARLVDPAGVDRTPNWRPDDGGSLLLRLPLPTQLDQLEALYERHRGVQPRVLPFRWVAYRRVDERVPGRRVAALTTPFEADEWIVFERSPGPATRRDGVSQLPLTRGVDLAERFRKALFRIADDERIALPETVTGHGPKGRRSEVPHMAVVPLPFVGHQHADGKLRGLALIMPRGSEEALEALLKVVGAWESTARDDPHLAASNADLDLPTLPIFLGRAGVFHLTRVAGDANIRTLRPRRWTGPSRAWRSVTPVALDHNPGRLYSTDPRRLKRALAAAKASMRRACANQHLPEPAAIEIQAAPVVSGSEHVRRFPPFPAVQRRDKPRRVLVHVALTFETPIRGPLLLGAGRYLGLGLFLPIGRGPSPQ